MALEALARREPDEELGEWLIDLRAGPQTCIFLLRALDRHVRDGLVSGLLTYAHVTGPRRRWTTSRA